MLHSVSSSQQRGNRQQISASVHHEVTQKSMQQTRAGISESGSSIQQTSGGSLALSSTKMYFPQVSILTQAADVRYQAARRIR